MNKMNKIVFILILLSFLPSIAVNSQEETFKINISMYPVDGSSATNIRLYISTEPPSSIGSWVLYVDYGDINIVNGKADIRVGKTNTYKHQWITVFNPPYGKEGKSYVISIIIFTSTGKQYVKYRSFKITDTIPKLSWFDDLSEYEQEQIRGDKGEKGDVGPQGESIVGPQGIQGIQGKEGKEGMQGESIVGPQGIQGIQGEKGDRGESYPKYLFYVIALLSLFAIIISLWALVKR